MIAKVVAGVSLLALAGLHHRYWYVLYRKRRLRGGGDLQSGKVRDVTDFLLKWRLTLVLLVAGWLFLSSSLW